MFSAVHEERERDPNESNLKKSWISHSITLPPRLGVESAGVQGIISSSYMGEIGEERRVEGNVIARWSEIWEENK